MENLDWIRGLRIDKYKMGKSDFEIFFEDGRSISLMTESGCCMMIDVETRRGCPVAKELWDEKLETMVNVSYLVDHVETCEECRRMFGTAQLESLQRGIKIREDDING